MPSKERFSSRLISTPARPRADSTSSHAGLDGAEVVASVALVLLATPIVLAYLLERSGAAMSPVVILTLAVGAAGAMVVWLSRGARWHADEVVSFVVVVALVLAWLLWLAWPALLPVGAGVDIAHHLMLIDYIERHWRLVHEPQVEAYLGEMVHYTPGSQVLAALAGAWSRTDGLHAVYPIVAWSVALKAGFVFLIARRLMPEGVPRIPLALTAVLFLLVPYSHVVGSFTHDSFLAQVVAELFTIAMWWALIVWDERPMIGPMLLYGIAGAAAFLTWPVWIGPPLLVLPVLVWWRRGLSVRERFAYLILGGGPIAAVAALYIAGRLAWVGYVRAGGAVVQPSTSEFGWVFPIVSVIGLGLLVARRRGRATAAFVAAIGLQAMALFKLNDGHGPGASYMALKMVYLAVYPLAVAAAVAVAAGWEALKRLGSLRQRAGICVAWIVAVVLGVAIVRPIARAPRPHPAITEQLNLAGQWARAHVDPACVDYLMSRDAAAYWLHLAVLGNPRMSARTGDTATFELDPAIVRWITPGGLRFAIADLSVVTERRAAGFRCAGAIRISRRGRASNRRSVPRRDEHSVENHAVGSLLLLLDGELSVGRIARDAVAARRADPQFLAHLNGDGRERDLVAARIVDDLVILHRLRVYLADHRAGPGPACLPPAGIGSALPGHEQQSVGRPPYVVHPESERDLVALHRRLTARETHERPVAPFGDVVPLSVLGNLEPVRTGRFAARHLLPSGAGVPFPDLAVVLAFEQLGRKSAAPTGGLARVEIRGGKAAVGQGCDGVQADGIGGDGAADPRDGRLLGANRHFEDLDRFAKAVVNDIERVDAVAARFQIETVGSEFLSVRAFERAGARIVGFCVEAFFRGGIREQPGRRPALVSIRFTPPSAPYAEAMSNAVPGTATRSSGPAWPQTNWILPTASQPAARGAVIPSDNANAKAMQKAIIDRRLMETLLTASDAIPTS